MGTLGGGAHQATGINDAGTVIGYSTDTEGRTWAWFTKEMSPASSARWGGHDWAWGINNEGVIVGQGLPEGAEPGSEVGWVYNGALQRVVYLGSGYEGVGAINNLGQVLGLAMYEAGEELIYEGFLGTPRAAPATAASSDDATEAPAPGAFSVP